MTLPQILITAILIAALLLFMWGRLRHDLVALLALMSCVVLGLVEPAEAFVGFGHPAVITVASVLILSRALSVSGAVEWVLRRVGPLTKTPQGHVGALSGIAAVLSGFMNNVGALAMLMPVAIQSAIKAKRAPALVLMPLSFGSILGGLVTLIGTPPNVIVAGYRGDLMGDPFAFFDYAPVGVPLAVAGVLYVAFVGWRLIPRERRGKASPDELFAIEAYVGEVRVPREGKCVGESLGDLEGDDDTEIQIVGLVRRKRRSFTNLRRESARAGDVLIVEGSPSALDAFVSKWDLRLADPRDESERRSLLISDDVAVSEVAVPPRAAAVGREAGGLRLQSSYDVRLLAVSRQGQPIRERLGRVRLRAGDVLLLQGPPDHMTEAANRLGLLPLATRDWQLGRRPLAWLSAAVFALAIAVIAAGLLPAPVALTIGALAVVITGIVPPRDVYESIDWPVIVLLGAMIPVAGVMESTGTTQLAAEAILVAVGSSAGVWLPLALVMIVTMTLSDVMNNAATAVVMAPLAAGIAAATGASADPFLMAVAVGASCAFLTPIGHQNNTLIMGPGGYAFSDYWRMGLPLEALIVLIGVPAILWAWPPFAG